MCLYTYFIYTNTQNFMYAIKCGKGERRRKQERERAIKKCPYSKCTWHNQNFLGLVVAFFFHFSFFFKIGYLDWLSFFGAFCCYFLFCLRAFYVRKFALNREPPCTHKCSHHVLCALHQCISSNSNSNSNRICTLLCTYTVDEI